MASITEQDFQEIVNHFDDIPEFATARTEHATKIHAIINIIVANLLKQESADKILRPIAIYIKVIVTTISAADAALALDMVMHNNTEQLTHVLLTEFGLEKLAPVK